MCKLKSLSLFFLKDLIYKKVFVVSLFVGLCFVILSLLLGPLSFREEERMAINFSLAGSQIALILLSILVGADFLRQDIEKNFIQSFLTRPISRLDYYLSKVIAFGFCLLCMSAVMWSAFVLVAFFTGVEGILMSLVPFFGFFLEAYLLFSFALLFSLFSTSILSIGLSFTIFIAGHWVNTFEYLSDKAESSFVKAFGYILSKLLPNFESLNWKSHMTYNEWESLNFYFESAIYAFCWLVVAVFIGCIFFNKKDIS